MDHSGAVRAAVDRAIADIELAMARVRSAQEVDWVSVLATRYREELFGAIRDLGGLRDHLDGLRASIS